MDLRQLQILQTIAETGLRSKTGALILAARRGESDLATPGPDFKLAAGDVLVVVGQPQQIKNAYKLLTGMEKWAEFSTNSYELIAVSG